MQIKGGYARRNSITFLSENYIAVAKRCKNGLVTVETRKRFGKLDQNRFFKYLKRIPLLRSILSLLTVLCQSKLIALALTGAVVVEIFPGGEELFGSKLWMGLDLLVSLTLVGLILFIFFNFKAVRRYHGAEHKAANAYAETNRVSLEDARRASRIHPRCGTNYMVIILFTAILVQFMANWDFDYSLLIGLAVAGEVIRSRKASFKKPFLRAGGVLQKYLFTAEPGEGELEVAVAALKALEEKEQNFHRGS